MKIMNINVVNFFLVIQIVVMLIVLEYYVFKEVFFVVQDNMIYYYNVLVFLRIWLVNLKVGSSVFFGIFGEIFGEG